MAGAMQPKHTGGAGNPPSDPAPGRPGATGSDTLVMEKATAFAPASVGNIGVGFDLLGHTIVGPGDRAQVSRIDEPVVRIVAIDGDVEGASRLPLEAALNTAGRALIALRERHG